MTTEERDEALAMKSAKSQRACMACGGKGFTREEKSHRGPSGRKLYARRPCVLCGPMPGPMKIGTRKGIE